MGTSKIENLDIDKVKMTSPKTRPAKEIHITLGVIELPEPTIDGEKPKQKIAPASSYTLIEDTVTGHSIAIGSSANNFNQILFSKRGPYAGEPVLAADPSAPTNNADAQRKVERQIKDILDSNHLLREAVSLTMRAQEVTTTIEAEMDFLSKAGIDVSTATPILSPRTTNHSNQPSQQYKK